MAFILESQRKYDFILGGIAEMELCLHQVSGKAAPLSVTLRQCTREEAETVYRLQNEVRAMMPNPELFMPDTLENIQS